MPGFHIPSGTGRSDFLEKKSRFIGEAAFAASPDEARERVSVLRSAHPRARHVAWAYVLGRDGALRGMSDDGEPRGTAGRPILDPIIGAGLTDTLVTVVRYFGGVKLGTGGLSAAYGRCSVEALNFMPRVPLILRKTVTVQVGYSVYEPLLRLLERSSGQVTKEDFGAEVRLVADIPEEGLEDFQNALGDASRGTAQIEIH
jgi:uncharacterized YigZ family protein